MEDHDYLGEGATGVPVPATSGAGVGKVAVAMPIIQPPCFFCSSIHSQNPCWNVEPDLFRGLKISLGDDNDGEEDQEFDNFFEAVGESERNRLTTCKSCWNAVQQIMKIRQTIEALKNEMKRDLEKVVAKWVEKGRKNDENEGKNNTVFEKQDGMAGVEEPTEGHPIDDPIATDDNTNTNVADMSVEVEVEEGEVEVDPSAPTTTSLANWSPSDTIYWRCSECSKYFRTKQSWETHAEKFHSAPINENAYICVNDTCLSEKRGFSSWAELDAHLVASHGKVSKFKGLSLPMDNLIVRDENGVLRPPGPCRKCGAVLATWKNTIGHEWKMCGITHSEEMIQKLPCRIRFFMCDKANCYTRFTDLCDFRAHKIRHIHREYKKTKKQVKQAKKKLQQCSFSNCTKTFSRLSFYHVHLVITHNVPEADLFRLFGDFAQEAQDENDEDNRDPKVSLDVDNREIAVEEDVSVFNADSDSGPPSEEAETIEIETVNYAILDDETGQFLTEQGIAIEEVSSTSNDSVPQPLEGPEALAAADDNIMTSAFDKSKLENDERRQCPKCLRILGCKSSFARHKLHTCPLLSTEEKKKNKALKDSAKIDDDNTEEDNDPHPTPSEKPIARDDRENVQNKCPKCFKLLSQGSLKRHLVYTCPLRAPEEKNKKLNYCPAKYCHTSFTSESKLQKHLEQVHTEENDNDPLRWRRMCEKCGKMVSKADFPAHQRRVHGPKLPCPHSHCSTKFQTEYTLRLHLKLMHSMTAEERAALPERIPIPCDICGVMVNGKRNILAHKKRVHFKEEREEEKVACSICEKVLANKASLKKHLNSHAGTRIPCAHCSKSFSRQDLVNQHVRRVHLQTDKPDVECEICHKFFYKLEHTIHMRRVHSGRVECPQCGKSCVNKGYLYSHIKTVHEKKLNHKCEICGKAFFIPAYLRRHMETVHKNKEEEEKAVISSEDETPPPSPRRGRSKSPSKSPTRKSPIKRGKNIPSNKSPSKKRKTK